MRNVTRFVSRIGRLLIELREIDRENRRKTEEPSIKTEIIEENRGTKQQNREKQRKNGKKQETEENCKKQRKQSKNEPE